MEPEFYRTFIGLPVKVGNEILEVRNHLVKSFADERISWVNPDNYHVTLRFLGDTKATALSSIIEALQREVKLPQKLSLPLSGPWSFGPRKKPRVVWLGFDTDEPFKYLKAETDGALEKCGWPKTDEPFRAHLTLGRVRSLTDTARFYHTLKEMNQGFAGRVWMDRIVLYRSELGGSGPIYSALSEWRFSD